MTLPEETDPRISPLVQPGLPSGFGLGTVPGPANPENPHGIYVALTIHTVTGSTFVFIPPNIAKQLAANLERIATVAGTGLHIPGES